MSGLLEARHETLKICETQISETRVIFELGVPHALAFQTLLDFRLALRHFFSEDLSFLMICSQLPAAPSYRMFCSEEHALL